MRPGRRRAGARPRGRRSAPDHCSGARGVGTTSSPPQKAEVATQERDRSSRSGPRAEFSAAYAAATASRARPWCADRPVGRAGRAARTRTRRRSPSCARADRRRRRRGDRRHHFAPVMAQGLQPPAGRGADQPDGHPEPGAGSRPTPAGTSGSASLLARAVGLPTPRRQGHRAVRRDCGRHHLRPADGRPGHERGRDHHAARADTGRGRAGGGQSDAAGSNAVPATILRSYGGRAPVVVGRAGDAAGHVGILGALRAGHRRRPAARSTAVEPPRAGRRRAGAGRPDPRDDRRPGGGVDADDGPIPPSAVTSLGESCATTPSFLIGSNPVEMTEEFSSAAAPLRTTPRESPWHRASRPSTFSSPAESPPRSARDSPPPASGAC